MTLKKYTMQELRTKIILCSDCLKNKSAICDKHNIEFVQMDELKKYFESWENADAYVCPAGDGQHDADLLLILKIRNDIIGRADEQNSTQIPELPNRNNGNRSESFVSFVPNTEGGELQECKSNTTPAKASPLSVVVPKESSPSSVSSLERCELCNGQPVYDYNLCEFCFNMK